MDVVDVSLQSALAQVEEYMTRGDLSVGDSPTGGTLNRVDFNSEASTRYVLPENLRVAFGLDAYSTLNDVANKINARLATKRLNVGQSIIAAESIIRTLGITRTIPPTINVAGEIVEVAAFLAAWRDGTGTLGLGFGRSLGLNDPTTVGQACRVLATRLEMQTNARAA